MSKKKGDNGGKGFDDTFFILNDAQLVNMLFSPLTDFSKLKHLRLIVDNGISDNVAFHDSKFKRKG